MLAKVIAWGETRDEAARSLERALRVTHLHGPATNRDLLCAVLGPPRVPRRSADDKLPRRPLRDRCPARPAAGPGRGRASRDRRRARRRGVAVSGAHAALRLAEQPHERSDGQLRRRRSGSTLGTARNATAHGASQWAIARCWPSATRSTAIRSISRSTAIGWRPGRQRSEKHDGVHWEITTTQAARPGSSSFRGSRTLRRPRSREPPALRCTATSSPWRSPRATTSPRETLLCIVEAMKMEQQLVAPYDAIVTSVEVAVGDSVETDQVLAVLEEHEEVRA